MGIKTSHKKVIAIMGATGTGKSTFIKHVTGDESVVIGHKIRSETSDVQIYSYKDPKSGKTVLLVDTPGFNDSREGVTDTDILEKIANFLNDNGGRKLNGIIYMHRISDVRMGGSARMNLRMFEALCGDHGLENVRIVTTNWDRVEDKEGKDREVDLSGPDGFEKLIAGGAKMDRQNDGEQSAKRIVSELVSNKPVLMRITKEMNGEKKFGWETKPGKKLGETEAGIILAEDIAKTQKNHEREKERLKKELEAAQGAKNEELRVELLRNQTELEEKMKRAAVDAGKLQVTRIEELERELALAKDRRPKGIFDRLSVKSPNPSRSGSPSL